MKNQLINSSWAIIRLVTVAMGIITITFIFSGELEMKVFLIIIAIGLLVLTYCFCLLGFFKYDISTDFEISRTIFYLCLSLMTAKVFGDFDKRLGLVVFTLTVIFFIPQFGICILEKKLKGANP